MLQPVVTRRPQFNHNNGWTPGIALGKVVDNSGRLVVSTPLDGLLYPHESEVLVVTTDELLPLLEALKEDK